MPRASSSSQPGPLPAPLDWGLVRVFLAVFDAGSLSAAAKALHAQQPTLSRQLALLEAQLGGALFERTGRGTAATRLALALEEPARRMAEAAEAMERGATRRRSEATGSVRITTSQVAASYLLPPLLADLREAEPGLQIELVASNQITNLLRREADIAVRMVRPDQASLVARKVGEVAIVAAAHERYLRRAGTPRDAAALAGHTLIGYDRDETIVRGFAQMGVRLTREQFALRTDDQLAYGRLVAAGAGIGFVARYNLAQWPRVQALLPQLRIPPLPCWLAVHREVRGNGAVRRVMDFLAERLPDALV